MDTHSHPTAESSSPPTRPSTILSSFLRGRPRGTSQSYMNIHLPPLPTNPSTTNTNGNTTPPPLSTPSQNGTSSPSPAITGHTTPRRRAAGPLVIQASVSQNTPNASSYTTGPGVGLGISHMLRRRRSAGSPPVNLNATGGVVTTTGPSVVRPTPTTNPPHRIRLVPQLDSRRSLRFDAISRDLREGEPPLRIGRFTDRSGLGLAAVNALGSNKLAFKSKVVSRAHAEIWVESAGFYIKDTKSSSGTFLNHMRLSPANTESRPYLIKDGDILQLGVDYQGGTEDIYKSVKIRIEVGREWQAGPNAFNTMAFKNIKTLAVVPPTTETTSAPPIKTAPKSSIPDCCICLFSVTIHQALFIAPCSHAFHYKCIRPLLESHHPAFSCPLCRTFADLEEDVEVEIEPEAEMDEGEEDNTPESDAQAEGDARGELATNVGAIMNIAPSPGLSPESTASPGQIPRLTQTQITTPFSLVTSNSTVPPPPVLPVLPAAIPDTAAADAPPAPVAVTNPFRALGANTEPVPGSSIGTGIIHNPPAVPMILLERSHDRDAEREREREREGERDTGAETEVEADGNRVTGPARRNAGVAEPVTWNPRGRLVDFFEPSDDRTREGETVGHGEDEDEEMNGFGDRYDVDVDVRVGGVAAPATTTTYEGDFTAYSSSPGGVRDGVPGMVGVVVEESSEGEPSGEFGSSGLRHVTDGVDGDGTVGGKRKR